MKNTNLKKQLYHVTSMLFQYERSAHTTHDDEGKQQHKRILKLLKLKPGIKKSELAEFFGFTADRVNEILKTLAAKDYILCNQNSENPDEGFISLSEKGLAACSEDSWQKADSEKIFTCLSDEDKESLSHILGILEAKLQQETKDFPDNGHFTRGHQHFRHHPGGPAGRGFHFHDGSEKRTANEREPKSFRGFDKCTRCHQTN